MKRDLGIVTVVWLVLTALCELGATFDTFPVIRSDKGKEIHDAYNALMMMGAPVFALVVAVLLYMVLRYRHRGRPEVDGPAIMGQGMVPRAWFAITSVLAVVLMIYPGWVGIDKVTHEEPVTDLVVNMQSTQWRWIVNYPDQSVTTLKELVLPVDKNVRFNITAADVIHSFWIPSFAMRKDAVPGMTTRVTLHTTALGSYEHDQNMRLQCSQLCGRDHADMWIPVRVVSEQEFNDWVAASGGKPGLKPTQDGTHANH